MATAKELGGVDVVICNASPVDETCLIKINKAFNVGLQPVDHCLCERLD